MLSKNKLLVLTALPFRRQGNQSMLRFIQMLIRENHRVCLISSGSDNRGCNTLIHDNFIYKAFPSINFGIINFISKISFKKAKKSRNWIKFKSEDILVDSSKLKLKNVIVPWLKFGLQIIDNILLLFYILIVFNFKIFNYRAIVSYEYYYFLTSKIISLIFFIKHINKFQGTYLKVSNGKKKYMVFYYPHLYYGINSSDLTIMVNDGTDGDYYANLRKCKNIFFEPHGVSVDEYLKNKNIPVELVDVFSNNIVFINMASGSSWKRVDRIIRACQYIDKKLLNKIKIITTYYGPGLSDLKQYCSHLGLSNTIIFCDKLDHIECNSLLRKSHALISVNDFSNLGNPVLEAIYYGIPVISINDGSLNGFLSNNIDSKLIDINDEFDKSLSSAIEKFSQNEKYYFKIKKAIINNKKINSLIVQQKKEYFEINKTLRGV